MYSEELFKVNFRVPPGDFHQLCAALQIPEIFVIENRSRFTGKETVFVKQSRMSEVGRVHTVALFAGRGTSEASRIVNHVACWKRLNPFYAHVVPKRESVLGHF